MEMLDADRLSVLMIGSTHYVDIGGERDAVIFYETAKAAHMRLPTGEAYHGTWQFTGTGYATDWRDGPNGNWQIGFTPGRFVYMDQAGVERGHVTRIVPGDAEGLVD